MNGVPLLHDYLLESARRLPDKIALVCQKQRVSYSEIDARSNALAHALLRRGVGRGDRVVIFADNTVETVVAFWAILKASAVVSVVNPLTKADKLAYLLNDCRATALVTDAHLATAFAPAAAKAEHLRAVIVSGALEDKLVAGLSGVVGFDAAMAGERRDAAPPRHAIDVDLAALIYTSGSTGDPKGVMLTHRSMLTDATSISTYLGNVEDDAWGRDCSWSDRSPIRPMFSRASSRSGSRVSPACRRSLPSSPSAKR